MLGRPDGTEAVAAVLFAVWLLVTIAYQFRLKGWVLALKRYDDFAMIPAWTFFAPNPATTDTHLLYRDKLACGDVMRWREVPFHPGPLRSLWNPRKRFQKGLSDLGNELRHSAPYHREDPDFMLIDTGFLALLNFVTCQPHASSAVYTQFAVARSYGRGSARACDVVFLSRFHRI